jgi:hypothetical protein
MPYRVAAGVLEHLLPIDAGLDPETLRACTLKVGEELRDAAPAEPAMAAAAITLTLDSTFIRSCEDGQRHLEVRLGNVETSEGARQVFAAVTKTDTAIEALIRRGLADVDKTADTELTAFTDGCSGLRSILVDAGVAEPPFLDWFHIAMRLQHVEKTASTLPADTPEREKARARNRCGSRPPALVHLEWQGKGCQGHNRAHPRRHAGLPGRTERPKEGSVVTPALDCAGRDRPLSDQPERLAGQLCRAPSCWFAGRHISH